MSDDNTKYSVGSQMSYHLKKTTNFDVNRINSIHHGKVGFSINMGRLIFRTLIVQDNLEKSGIPPKSVGSPSIIQQLINVIDLNRKTYYGIKNGKVYFLIKNWKIYKQEVFLSDLELENVEGKNNLPKSDDEFPNEDDNPIETILEGGPPQ